MLAPVPTVAHRLSVMELLEDATSALRTQPYSNRKYPVLHSVHMALPVALLQIGTDPVAVAGLQKTNTESNTSARNTVEVHTCIANGDDTSIATRKCDLQWVNPYEVDQAHRQKRTTASGRCCRSQVIARLARGAVSHVSTSPDSGAPAIGGTSNGGSSGSTRCRAQKIGPSIVNEQT